MLSYYYIIEHDSIQQLKCVETFFSIIHINYSYSDEKDIYIVVSVNDDETAVKHG